VTGRTDIVVRVGSRTSAVSGRDPATGEARYAPGVWWPGEAVVELDSTWVEPGADVESLDLTDVSTLVGFGVFHGVALHEAGHVSHTDWTQEGWSALSPEVRTVVGMLEDSRMEFQRVKARPSAIRWLRMALHRILLDELADIDVSCWDVGRVAALILARADVGVFTFDEAAPIEERVIERVGADALAALRSLWQEAHECADGDLDALADVARRWCDTLAELDDDDDNDDDDEGEGEGEGWADLADLVKEIAESEAGTFRVEIAEERSAVEAQRRRDKADAIVAARREAAVEAAIEAGRKLFAEPTSDEHHPGLKGWREPSGAERIAAVDLAEALQERIVTPPGRVKECRTTPPGRLRTRGMLKGAAQRSLGLPDTAEMWEGTKVVHHPPLRLKVALAVDRSGSMCDAIDAICGASWVTADACRRVDGEFAAALFGAQAEPLCAPGTIPAQVPVLRADAPYEAIGDALESLRGALDLNDRTAVRLVVIASDAEWVDPAQNRKGLRQIGELTEAGCTVIVMHSDSDVDRSHGCPVIVFDPDEFATTLNAVIVDAIDATARR
jgi:hypothetical protein